MTSPRNTESRIFVGDQSNLPQGSPEIAVTQLNEGELQSIYILDWGNGLSSDVAAGISGCWGLDSLAPYIPMESEDD
jgi:hypothetical protein